MGFRHRAQAFFWEHNRPLRSVGRELKKVISLAAYRLRRMLLDPDLPPRVVTKTRKEASHMIADPAVSILTARDISAADAASALSTQTELSVDLNPRGALNSPYCLFLEPGFESLPPTHIEALLLAAAADDLGWVVGGWSTPAPSGFGPSGNLWRDADSSPQSSLMYRLPTHYHSPGGVVLGRAVAHIRNNDGLARCEPLEQPFAVGSGPYRLRPDSARRAIVIHTVHEVDHVLSKIPEVDGPQTVMFLLPFLAVGGAEKLLRDLIGSMKDRFRVLVVTTDPHLEQLGATVESFRRLTPHVYTLGDWIPQQAVPSAIRHLIRRWRVESLMCWNGNVMFFDQVADLKKRYPALRIINQLFNHEGGWIEHYCRTVIDDVDCHVAVNTQVARSLIEDRSVPPTRVSTIFHGVEIPEPPAPEGAARRREQIRRRLGIRSDAVVVGTFIRLHQQKRPHDVIRVARKLSSTGVHFLLVGGGPMGDSVDREIERLQLPNLTRLPMQQDPTGLYDALDICLMTSSFEGLPVFLLDGLARGIPCVSTAVGDVPLLLEHGGGISVDRPGDIDGLVDAVRALAEDDEERQRQGDLGRARVASEFSLEKFFSAYEAVIFPPR